MSDFFSKKSTALRALAHPSAPRVFTPAELSVHLVAIGAGDPMSARSIGAALSDWASSGLVTRVSARLYLNDRARPKPRLDEAAQRLRPGAVVSGPRVLSDAGILYNPVSFVSAVMPVSGSRRSGQLKTPAGEFLFSALSDDFFCSPNDPDRDDFLDMSFVYPRATPEKAVLDLVRLNMRVNGPSAALRPAADWDWSLIDSDRLARLIGRLDFQKEWRAAATVIGAPVAPPPSTKKKTKTP